MVARTANDGHLRDLFVHRSSNPNANLQSSGNLNEFEQNDGTVGANGTVDADVINSFDVSGSDVIAIDGHLYLLGYKDDVPVYLIDSRDGAQDIICEFDLLPSATEPPTGSRIVVRSAIDALLGLGVNSTSKVPNRGSRDRYHIDSSGIAFSAKSAACAFKNLRQINGQNLKTALSATNARPSQIVASTFPCTRRPHDRGN